jgi:V8-like Glu-specific endopeptidase
MRLVIIFLALLPILVVHTTIFEAHGTKKSRLLSMIDDSRTNERTHHSSATSLRSRTNENIPKGLKNIFGIDKRTPMTSTAYPWRAIGKLSTGCTGALVVSNGSYN